MDRVMHKFYSNGFILVLLGSLAIAGPLLGHPMKFDRDKRMGFAQMIPQRLGQWERISARFGEQMPAELDVNEIYQALYAHPDLGQIALTLEYTSDSRREFELHYPDVCHSIRGDKVVTYAPGRFDLADGRHINAAMMSWQQANGGFSAVTAYWYITADGVTTDSMKLKIKQALSGLLSRPEDAVMVRFDAFYEEDLRPQKRMDLFASIQAFNQSIEREIDSKANILLYKQLNSEET